MTTPNKKAPFVHPSGLCESTKVGAGTRIWAFAHVLPGATIGTDCNICDHVLIENDVVVGDRVTVKSGVQLWDGVHLEDDVFVGPNVTFTNDPFPRSKVYPDSFARTVVRKGASLGGNATVLPGLEIGGGAMVGAGAVVTRSVPPRAIVLGNPARIVGYVDSTGRRRSAPTTAPQANVAKDPDSYTSRVVGVRLHRLPRHSKVHRNAAEAIFSSPAIPFTPIVSTVASVVPGEHAEEAHARRESHQFLACVSGGCSILVDNGRASEEFRLDAPDLGLYLPPMTWSARHSHTAGAVVIIFASHLYRPEDLIRDYSTFLMSREATASDGRGPL